jgi:hypothetical protein
MNDILGKVGSYAAIFGIASTVMSFFDYNIRLLIWIDMWGETTGWIIRAGMIIIGGLLWFKFGRDAGDETEQITNEAE